MYIYIYIWSVISFYLSIYSNLTKSILYYSKLIYIIHVISESNLCNLFIYLSICLSVYLSIYLYLYLYLYLSISIYIYLYLSFFLSFCIALHCLTSHYIHYIHIYIHKYIHTVYVYIFIIIHIQWMGLTSLIHHHPKKKHLTHRAPSCASASASLMASLTPTRRCLRPRDQHCQPARPGTPNHPDLMDHDLVLKPMVTWGSTILGKLHMMDINICIYIYHNIIIQLDLSLKESSHILSQPPRLRCILK